MKDFYEIECKVLDVIESELKQIIEKLKILEGIYEFNIVLDDLLESIEVGIDLVKRDKINTGMTVLRSSYELVVTYVAIIKNSKIREDYLDVNKRRNIKLYSNEVTKCVGMDVYEEVYKMLCEFAHPTLMRSYYCDSNKIKNALNVNRNICLFFMLLTLSEYKRWLGIVLNKQDDFTLDSLMIMFSSSFCVWLKTVDIDERLIRKYNSIFYDKNQKEKLLKNSKELNIFFDENKEVLVKRLQGTFSFNHELKKEIIEYINANC